MPSKIRQSNASGEFNDGDWKYGPLLQVRTLYIAFTQGLFAAAPPGTYRWAPMLEDTEIVITDENPINVDVVGKRPAIGFTRGPVQSYSLGQDDLLHYDFQTGAKKKSVLVPGTMSINCCSRVDIESEQIGWVVAEQLWMHRELLMRAGFFEIGRQFVVGSPSPAGSIVVGDSADEWYVTTVSSPFQFYRTSQFNPLGAQIVNQLGFTLNLQGNIAQALGPNPASAIGPAVNISSSAPGVGANRQPHPLNPAQQVVVRGVHPNRPGLRPPAMGGRVLPIQREPVEQSSAPVTVVTRTSFKV